MRKAITTAAIMMAAMMTLAACTTEKPADTTTPAAVETAPSAATAKTDAATEPAEQESTARSAKDGTTILVAAAASLKYSYEDKLIPMFEKANPGIRVEATFDSSGKLQTQIEEGLDADVFMSAAMKQLNALKDEKMIDADSVVELLENKIVLITGADYTGDIKRFEDIVKSDSIAIGDPDSVPAGQYAKEALTSLGLWDEAEPKLSLGTNVTEVLNWVAEGSAQAGIVYATDAAANDKVKVIAQAPEGSLAKNVIYPVGIVSASQKKDAAQKFVKFLQSDEALAVFETYGFTANNQ